MGTCADIAFWLRATWHHSRVLLLLRVRKSGDVHRNKPHLIDWGTRGADMGVLVILAFFQPSYKKRNPRSSYTDSAPA